jgi:membrane protein insertase Oxa1/YidC/SpoIIIJ
MLYTIIIYPIYQLIEIFYVLFHKVFDSVSYAILGVSVGVTIFCLPLNVVAEKWQKIEREIQSRMEPKIKKIKSVFKGDEQYLILSAYYRQNHYHPIYALRSSLGIFIQIPFFIAAYIYLSHKQELSGEHFLLILALGKPDSLLTYLISGGRG